MVTTVTMMRLLVRMVVTIVVVAVSVGLLAWRALLELGQLGTLLSRFNQRMLMLMLVM
jgi:hypothetical protein